MMIRMLSKDGRHRAARVVRQEITVICITVAVQLFTQCYELLEFYYDNYYKHIVKLITCVGDIQKSCKELTRYFNININEIHVDFNIYILYFYKDTVVHIRQCFLNCVPGVVTEITPGFREI